MTADYDIVAFIEPITAHFPQDRLLEPHGVRGSYVLHSLTFLDYRLERWA